jgi:hypothetical protein
MKNIIIGIVGIKLFKKLGLKLLLEHVILDVYT